MPDRILAQAGTIEEPERRCLFTLTVWHIFLLYISMTLYLRKRRFCSRLPLLFTLVLCAAASCCIIIMELYLLATLHPDGKTNGGANVAKTILKSDFEYVL